MKPVDQTIFDDGRGNCYSACVASLLELTLSEVPNFVESDDMHDACADWLAARHLSFVRMMFRDHESLQSTFFYRPGQHTEARLCILSGTSPRKRANGGVKHHGVVARAGGWGVEVVHDPHPSRDGLSPDGERWVAFIVGDY